MPRRCSHPAQRRALTVNYDEEARASGWLGPEVAFGLSYEYVRPGQSVLDIGIGTGLASLLFRKAGLRVYGMDVSPEMLDVCRRKGFTDLKRHDLTEPPYPYAPGSLDHAICAGVLNFFRDLAPVFQECARILRAGGLFVFVVGDRSEGEATEIGVEADLTMTGGPVTIYRHSARQISAWVGATGFTPLKSLAFTMYMDRERTRPMQAKAYLIQKSPGGEPSPAGNA